MGRGVRVAPGEVRDPGEIKPSSDLLTLLGRPGKDSQPSRVIRRPARGRKVPGRTLFIRDSFGDVAVGLLSPYFAELRELFWFNSSARERAVAIARADTVIYENVEREFAARALGLVNPELLRQLRLELRRSGGP